MPKTDQSIKQLRIAIIEAKGWKFVQPPVWCENRLGESRKLPDLKYWTWDLLLEMAYEGIELKHHLVGTSGDYAWFVKDDYDHGVTYAVHEDPVMAVCLGWLKWKGVDISQWLPEPKKTS